MPTAKPKPKLDTASDVSATAAVTQNTLPRSIAVALPAAVEIMRHVGVIEALVPRLKMEMQSARDQGAIPLARAYVVLHRLREALLSEEKNRFKPIGALFKDYSEKICPETFEQAGVTNVPLTEGLRVQVAYAFRASIKGGQKDLAYQWLRGNQLTDLITATVNASSLSAALKALRDDKNLEAPAELFNAADVPYTSVVKA